MSLKLGRISTDGRGMKCIPCRGNEFVKAKVGESTRYV